jgi:ABC-type tungstate transport system permease subunit
MASDHKAKIFVAALLLALVFSSRTNGAEVTQQAVILSTTTSTQDSGLLDVLIPLFEKQTGYSVKTISVGTGQALALAAKGDADVALVHAPSLEKQYVADGKLLNRRLVMYNDFVIIGPKEDPAKGHRAEGRLVYRGWTGHGRHARHRQRAQRLYDHGSGNLFGARETRQLADFDRR